MEQLIHAVKASSAAAAALGATALALLGLLLAYQRTRAVERREQAVRAGGGRGGLPVDACSTTG